MTIGERIALARKKAKLSQEQLAKKVGIRRGYLAQIEVNHVGVRATLMEKLSKALSVPISFFVGEDLPELTEFATKAKKYDKIVSLIRESGAINGTVEKNVVVSGENNNVVINSEQQMIIEQLLKKDAEERELLLKILQLKRGERNELLHVYKLFREIKKTDKTKQ